MDTSTTELAQKVLAQCFSARTPSKIVDVSSRETTAHIRSLAIPPRQPADPDVLLAASQTIFSHRVAMDHPRFFGFIPSPASDTSWLGDMLNSAYNTHAGSWYQSSGPSAVEAELLSWMAGLEGYPASPGGRFVSGGSMANLTAMTAARERLAFEDRSRAIVYLSTQTHSSVAKGLHVLGFHPRQIRKVECDSRMRVDRLQAAIDADRSQGLLPFLVVGSAGTTNTGAIDPLNALADVAEREGLWLHVDGAYGASALLVRRELFAGIERCDSLSWDAHKWLFQTYGCGIVLVRDRKVLRDTFGVSAEYVQDAAETEETLPNFWNYGIELTRPARAMKLWFYLQAQGLDRVERDIEHGILLAEVAERTLRGIEGWEVVWGAQLGILCFRYLRGSDLDAVNQRISQIAIEENLAAPLTTRLDGMLVLRICCIHPGLWEEEMVEIIGGLNRIAKGLSSNG